MFFDVVNIKYEGNITTTSRLTLGSTQPSMQWILRALSPGASGRDVKLTTHHLLLL
jgi:hypothetical protein